MSRRRVRPAARRDEAARRGPGRPPLDPHDVTVQITARLTRSRVDALLKRYPGARLAEAIRRAVDDALAQP